MLPYPRYFYQLSNVFLMGFQSFVLPLLVGFSEYGRAMLYLAPVYLYQALLEPVFQGFYGDKILKKNHSDAPPQIDLGILLYSFVGLFLLIFVCYLFLDDFSLVSMLFIIGFFYLLSTKLQACILFRDGYSFVGVSIFLSVFFYMGAYFINELKFDFILWGNIFYFSAFFVFLFLRFLFLGGEFCFSREFGWVRVWGYASTRAAYVFSGNGLMIAFGAVGYSAEKLGMFRFTLSVMNAGRYFNPVPIVDLQKGISEYIYGGGSRDFVIRVLQFFIFSSIYGLLAFLVWVFYFYFAKGIYDLNYLFLLVPIYLLIQPLAYFFVIKGYVALQFYLFMCAAIGALLISYYDMRLSFGFMLVSAFSLMVLFLFKKRKI